MKKEPDFTSGRYAAMSLVTPSFRWARQARVNESQGRVLVDVMRCTSIQVHFKKNYFASFYHNFTLHTGNAGSIGHMESLPSYVCSPSMKAKATSNLGPRAAAYAVAKSTENVLTIW